MIICHFLWPAFKFIIDANKIESTVAQKESALLETEGPWVRASSASLCCVFEQDTFILAFSTGSNGSVLKIHGQQIWERHHDRGISKYVLWLL